VRIVHAIETLAPVGGAQTYAHAASAQLAAAGHEVVVVHRDQGASPSTGVSDRSFATDAEAERWIERFAPDVVHAHDWALWDADGEQEFRYPVLRSLHGFTFACAAGLKYFRDDETCTRPHGPGCFASAIVRGCPHRLDPRPFVTGYRRLNQVLPRLRREGRLALHSRYMRDVALANGLPPARCELVLPFVQRPAAPEPAPRSGETTIAFVGRVIPEKGLDVLLQALASTREAWDRLLVLGDGWDRPRCERRARRLGLARKVAFLGHRNSDDVAATLAKAHVVAVPSRWPEPFGIVGLEAMAHARPVIAGRVGGIPEWLDDGTTGLLVPPGDSGALARALTSILGDAARGERMGLEGWRRVDRFSPEKHLEALVGAYERAAAPSAATPTSGATGGW